MKSLGFQEIPKKSKKQQRQKKANNAAEVPLPSRQQPPRIRAMVDLSYGVNEWDNSTGRKRQQGALSPPPNLNQQGPIEIVVLYAASKSSNTSHRQKEITSERSLKYSNLAVTRTRNGYLGLRIGKREHAGTISW